MSSTLSQRATRLGPRSTRRNTELRRRSPHTKVCILLVLAYGYTDTSSVALLDCPEIDAVYNPLPTGLHYEWSMKTLLAGKHLLLEKPSTCTAEETRQLYDLAEKRGLVLLEGLHYRCVAIPPPTTFRTHIDVSVASILPFRRPRAFWTVARSVKSKASRRTLFSQGSFPRPTLDSNMILAEARCRMRYVSVLFQGLFSSSPDQGCTSTPCPVHFDN